jgi:CelD/BcsL family acetyltransferase involved in cellulose biosynthesis
MSDTLTVERVADAAALAGLKTAWDGLLAANATRTVELTHAWQSPYWEYLHDGAELYVLVVRDGERVVGIAPLRLKRVKKFGVAIRCLDFIALRQSNYQDYHRRVLARIHRYLVDHQRDWDVLRLFHLSDQSPTVRFALRQADLKPRLAQVKPTCYLAVEGSWHDYAAATGSKRKLMRQNQNRLKRAAGDVSSFCCRTRHDFETHLRAFFDLHRQRWNGTNTTSQFNDPRYCHFYRATVPKLFPEGQIALFVLTAGGAPSSMLYTFIYEREHLLQLVAYNPAHAAGSPGSVILEHYVRHAFEDNACMVDFGDYFPYKAAWTNRVRNKLNIELYARRLWPSQCVYWFQTLRGYAKGTFECI